MITLNLILALLALKSIVNNIAIWLIIRRFADAHFRAVQLSKNKWLVLILKVYKEEALIEDTIRHIAERIQ